MSLSFPQLTMLPLARYAKLLGPERLDRVMARISVLRARLTGRVVWNVSSTMVGGGVAEMVRSLLAYARGAGVDARWAVIQAPPDFFRFTKQIHNALHGATAEPFEPEDGRALFEAIDGEHAAELAAMVRPHDIVIVHDPQPAGMVPALAARGAQVIWRCHIGRDESTEVTERAWRFLAPYLQPADAYVFSRRAYVPVRYLDPARAKIIPPTIDPFSAKNQALPELAVRAILRTAGLVTGKIDPHAGTFLREDGTPCRVDRAAVVVREGPPPSDTTPLVVQVSRWDRLKDPRGVLEGWARLGEPPARAHLVLAGPQAVADDPEGADVLADVTAAWSRLPAAVRRCAHLASLPIADLDENAAIVNALQRHAAVVVQKSLQEGFGLTVSEAMWKARPVVASAVGGIQDQIDDGVQGLLLHDPTDLDAFASAVAQLLEHRDEARRMGARGHARVLERFLGLDSLLRYGALIEWLDEGGVRRSEAVERVQEQYVERL